MVSKAKPTAKSTTKGINRQMGTSDAMTVTKEAGIHVTRPTMINWCKTYGIGHQLGTGRWMVFENKLVAFLNGIKKDNNGS
jgi:hypothetical protein